MTTLSTVAAELGIESFLICFTDLAGTPRAKLVPRAAIDDMVSAGAAFAGFGTWLDMTPADPDMFAIPDATSLIQLPWKKEVGWLAADLWMNGVPVEHAPRNVLKRLIAKAFREGYWMKTGVECEYFLIPSTGDGISDPADVQEKPAYDLQALMRRFDLVSEICNAMSELDWHPYQTDHEDANGQFEVNWRYDDALKTADRHLFFKYMTKSVAEKHGMRATFMPKPFSHLTGNGCHTHISLWSTSEPTQNLFFSDGGELGLSPLAFHFIGGVMYSAEALCALTNPTVNSYKRINASGTRSGATWSPNAVTYSGNNRTHMIRVPEPGRFELRLADGSANPYLLQAGILAAGLDGIRNARDPGQKRDMNMYELTAPPEGARLLPRDLLDAIRHFEQSKIFREWLGADFIGSFTRFKRAEWAQYSGQVTDWERRQTLDC